jgi:hypothetical protein
VNALKKLDSNANVIQTVTVGTQPDRPVFDGSNIWVPNLAANSLSVVRASDEVVLATLTGNGLSNPVQAAFDGQFILVTNGTGKQRSDLEGGGSDACWVVLYWSRHSPGRCLQRWH